MSIKREIVERVRLVKKAGWDYFVDGDGDVARVQDSDLEHPERVPEIIKVKRLHLERDRHCYYHLAPDGAIVKEPLGRLPRGDFNPLEIVHSCSSYFESLENVYWLYCPGRPAPLGFVGPGRTLEHVTANPPESWSPGDRVILSRGGLTAIGEIMQIADEREPHGQSFDVAWFSARYRVDAALGDKIRDVLMTAHLRVPDVDDREDVFVRMAVPDGNALASLLVAAHPEVGVLMPDILAGTAPSAAMAGGALRVYEMCWYTILGADRLTTLEENGGGTADLKGNWIRCREFLANARRTNRELLVLFDEAGRFLNPGLAGVIADVEVTRTGDRTWTSRVTFAHVQRLRRRYLFAKLKRASDRRRVSASYQRDALPCLTPRLFREQGLPATSMA